MKNVRRVVLVVVLALLVYPGWLSFRIWDQSHADEIHHADAIIVLGAAQYDGDPSPVYKARLDHAAYLFEQGLASTIITTGGKQPGDRFTEAEAGSRYLAQKSVPADAIVEENVGRTTLQSLQGARDIARSKGMDSALFVSDPLHSERIKRMASDLGWDSAFTSPASYVELNRSRLTKIKELAHETGSLLLYELFQR